MSLTWGGSDGGSVTGWLNPRQAAERLCGVTPRTVRNLISVGTRTPAGRVRLRAVTLGGRYFTRREWVDEYLEAVTTLREGEDARPEQTPTARDRRFAAEQELVRRRLGGR